MCYEKGAGGNDDKLKTKILQIAGTNWAIMMKDTLMTHILDAAIDFNDTPNSLETLGKNTTHAHTDASKGNL